MAMIDDLIRLENEGSISFGNYLLTNKTKVENFQAFGHSYKVKSYEALTRLEKDGILAYESTPGTVVYNFTEGEKAVHFTVEGQGDTQITLEVEPTTEYKLYIQNVLVSKVKSNGGGKIVFAVEAGQGRQKVKLEKL